MESLVTLFFQLVGGIAKSRDGKYIAIIILLGTFVGMRESAHAEEKDTILMEANKKTEGLLIVCEKDIAKKTEIIDSLKEKIADLKMQVALCKLK